MTDVDNFDPEFNRPYLDNSGFTFFWHGPFSNWAKSPFYLDGVTYSCVEQYMMYKKAILFSDTEIAGQILETDKPRIQKELGRKVRGFNPDMWNSVARDVVFRGCHAKFTQNLEMHDILLNTGSTLLVEASPQDPIWGIGLDEEEAKRTPPGQWPGKNWLGQVITEVRDGILFTILRDEVNSISQILHRAEGDVLT